MKQNIKIDSIDETEKNIRYWESEIQKALKENDKYRALYCRKLVNQLKKELVYRKG